MSGADTRRWGRWSRTLGTLGLAGALVLGAVAPAWADPGDPDVPNPGARPQPGAGLPGAFPAPPGAGLPGRGPENGTTPPTMTPPVMGPMATQIATEQQAVALLGEQVKEAKERLAGLRTLLDTARKVAKGADDARERAEGRTANSAAEAYRESAAVPDELRDVAPGLQHLAPGMRDSSLVDGKAAADGYQAADELADTAEKTLEAAQEAVWTAADQLAKLKRQFDKRSKALAALMLQNADALREAQEAADRAARNIDYDPGSAVNGLNANPKALKAVRYALAQLGKPYVWGDEGPDTFDCSGLVWAAYKFAGVSMNARTARQQFYSTPMVAPGHMLPGDLVFFGPRKNDPESIHHVGIYIGKGQIVHAPTAGDVVKISPIWWWEFFAATRVVPAVKAPSTKPKPTPSPSPSSPKPTPSASSPKPTPSSPKPSWSTSPKPSATPSTQPSPTPAPDNPSSPPPSPSPSTSPSGGGSGSESGDCPSPSATPSGSASPSPSPTASPSGSTSPTPDPCADSTTGTTEETSHSAGGWVAYPTLALAPSQKAATVAVRRRTTVVVRVRARRRRMTD